jgi:hypothetical protein
MSSVPGQPVPGVALAIDSRIRTSNGWKTLDRVSIGEALASDDGISSVVTQSSAAKRNRSTASCSRPAGRGVRGVASLDGA